MQVQSIGNMNSGVAFKENEANVSPEVRNTVKKYMSQRHDTVLNKISNETYNNFQYMIFDRLYKFKDFNETRSKCDVLMQLANSMYNNKSYTDAGVILAQSLNNYNADNSIPFKEKAEYFENSQNNKILTDFFLNSDKEKAKMFVLNSLVSSKLSGFTPVLKNISEQDEFSQTLISKNVIDNVNKVLGMSAEASKKTMFEINNDNLLSINFKQLINRLPQLKAQGIKTITGMPLYGKDTAFQPNPYQLPEQLGTREDFEKLVSAMFVSGISPAADLNVKSEPANGLHLRDILQWGPENSPFSNRYCVPYNGNMIKIGLEPYGDDYDHTRFKLINADYKVEFEKVVGGYKETAVVKNRNYNSLKPTYLQIFDDRMVSDNQVNSDEPFYSYEKSGNMDYKARPFAIRVFNREVDANYKNYKEIKKYDKNSELKSTFSRWRNYEIDTGNRVPEKIWNADMSRIYSSFDENINFRELQKGNFQLKDEVLQLGKYWTNEVEHILYNYVGAQLSNQIEANISEYENMEDKDVHTKVVKDLVKMKKLPPSALNIFEKAEGEEESPYDLAMSYNIMGGRNYRFHVKKTPAKLTEELMNFVPESIEFAPDLSTLLAYPHLKNYAVNEDTLGKSRYELYEKGDEYYDELLDKYRKIYKNSDNFIAGPMREKALKILEKTSAELEWKLVENGEINKSYSELLTGVLPELTEFLYISAIAPEIKPVYKKDNEFGERLYYNPQDLKNVSVESLNLQYEVSPENMASNLLNKMTRNINNIPKEKVDNFVQYLKRKLEHRYFDNDIIAKLIVEKSGAGLNWKIDNLNDILDGDKNYYNQPKENYEYLNDFWKEFANQVKTNGANSNIIAELKSEDLGIYDGDTDISSYKKSFEFNTKLISEQKFLTSDKGLQSTKKFRPHSDDGEKQLLEKACNIMDTKSGSVEFYRALKDLNVQKHNDAGLGFSRKIVLAHSNSRDNLKLTMVNEIKKLMNDSKLFKRDLADYKNLLENSLEKVSNTKEYYYKGKKYETYMDFENREIISMIENMFEQAAHDNSVFANYASRNPEKLEVIKADMLKTFMDNYIELFAAYNLFMAGMPGYEHEVGFMDRLCSIIGEYQGTMEEHNRVFSLRDNNPNFKFEYNHKIRLRDEGAVRKTQGGESLIFGEAVPLKAVKIDKENAAAVIYRKNEDSDAFCIFHNKGFKDNNLKSENYVDAIPLSSFNSGEPLPKSISAGTVYYNAIKPDEKFKIMQGTHGLVLINSKGGKINLRTSGLILLREKNFLGENNLKIENGEEKVIFLNKMTPTYKKYFENEY